MLLDLLFLNLTIEFPFNKEEFDNIRLCVTKITVGGLELSDTILVHFSQSVNNRNTTVCCLEDFNFFAGCSVLGGLLNLNFETKV
jgi:hypothetical protein